MNTLSSAEFIPSYQQLQQHDPLVATVVTILYHNPALMAKVIEYADVYMASGELHDRILDKML